MDTSGQERFRAINESYYRNADCCLLVYDITNKKSFEECKYYIQQIKDRCKQNIKVIVLGNKTDLEDQRQIPAEEGVNFAFENHCLFMETSCLKNENVADAFETLIELTNREEIKNNVKRHNSKIIITQNTQINTNRKVKKGCC